MKFLETVFICGLIVLFLGSCGSQSDESAEKVTVEEVVSFIGKPIHTLVDHLVADGPANSKFIEEPTGYLVGVYVRRTESRQVINIYIQHPGTVEPYDTLQSWILEEVYEEIIDTVTIYNFD